MLGFGFWILDVMLDVGFTLKEIKGVNFELLIEECDGIDFAFLCATSLRSLR